MDKNGIILSGTLAVAGFGVLFTSQIPQALVISGVCFTLAFGGLLAARNKFDPKDTEVEQVDYN
jgi:hypothetical protein